MHVNNKDFDYFGMKVYSFTYQPLSMSAIIFKSDNDLHFVHGGFTIEPKPMDLICSFKDKENISEFLKSITENIPTVIDIDDGFRYECWYKGGNSHVNEVWNNLYKVTFPFLVIQKSKTLKKVTLQATENKVVNSGTYKCPYILEIFPKTDISNLTVDNFIIKNLRANQKFVIDGDKKKVYDQYGNRFSDVEFLNNKFPFLKTGINKIQISNIQNVEIVIKYREVFL